MRLSTLPSFAPGGTFGALEPPVPVGSKEGAAVNVAI